MLAALSTAILEICYTRRMNDDARVTDVQQWFRDQKADWFLSFEHEDET